MLVLLAARGREKLHFGVRFAWGSAVVPATLAREQE